MAVGRNPARPPRFWCKRFSRSPSRKRSCSTRSTSCLTKNCLARADNWSTHHLYEHYISCLSLSGIRRFRQGNRRAVRLESLDFSFADDQFHDRCVTPRRFAYKPILRCPGRATAADRRRPAERGEDQKATRGSGAALAGNPGQGQRRCAENDRRSAGQSARMLPNARNRKRSLRRSKSWPKRGKPAQSSTSAR